MGFFRRDKKTRKSVYPFGGGWAEGPLLSRGYVCAVNAEPQGVTLYPSYEAREVGDVSYPWRLFDGIYSQPVEQVDSEIREANPQLFADCSEVVLCRLSVPPGDFLLIIACTGEYTAAEWTAFLSTKGVPIVSKSQHDRP